MCIVQDLDCTFESNFLKMKEIAPNTNLEIVWSIFKNYQYRRKKIILADFELHTVTIVLDLTMDYGGS